MWNPFKKKKEKPFVPIIERGLMPGRYPTKVPPLKAITGTVGQPRPNRHLLED